MGEGDIHLLCKSYLNLAPCCFPNFHCFAGVWTLWQCFLSLVLVWFIVAVRMGRCDNHWLCKSNFIVLSYLFTEIHLLTGTINLRRYFYFSFFFCLVWVQMVQQDHQWLSKSHFILVPSFIEICHVFTGIRKLWRYFLSSVLVRFSVSLRIGQRDHSRLRKFLFFVESFFF